MKRGIRKKNIAMIISLCICLVFILSFYTQYLNKEISNHIDETFNEVALQYQNHFNKELENMEILLESFADDIVVDNSIEIKDNIKILKTYCKQFDIERIGVILENKDIYATDDKEYTYNNEEYFEKAFQGQNTYSSLIKENNNKVLYLSIPIEINNKVEGILFSVITQDTFSKKMDTTSFDGKGYSYIIDNNGELITYSTYNENTKNIDNIYDYIISSHKDNEDVVNVLKENLKNNQNGYIEFVNGTNNYLHYSVLDVNDWNQILVVPCDSLSHTLYSVMTSTTLMVCSVIIILFLITGIVSKIIKKDNEELNEVLYLDKLTGEDSFEKFYEEAGQIIKNNHTLLAYVILDINQFKLINDFYGYKEGDKTLRFLSSIIKERLEPGEIFGRRIADKFEILLKYQDVDILTNRINDIYEAIKGIGKKDEGEYFIEPVMGVCLIDTDDHDFIDIKNKTMIAHSFAKRKNDADVLFYQEDFKKQIAKNKVLSDQLNVAYLQKEFVVYYQPKYDIHTQEIIGAEALVRWKKEDGTIIPPSVFIPLAESNGFIKKIDYEVFKQVCLKQKELLDQNKNIVPISVNVSRRVLKDDSFIDDYKKIVDELNIPIEYIQLEITESALFENQDNFLKIIKKLKEVGFKILMDDFGIGYSSLTMLEMLPIDIIKLDKAFVDHYKEVRGQAIMKSVIDLADSLNMGVIAEGVETEEQYHFLKDLSCYAIQGYYFSKPVDSDTYVQMIQG